MNTASRQAIQPKYLWFLILTYSMIIIMSNWFDARLIQLFNITIAAGTLIFPVTFLISDIITEVYGYKNARLAIWIAFLFNIIFLLYGQLVTHLPSPSFAVNNQAFDRIFSLNIMIVLGSIISYLISEPLNSFIVAKLKIKFQGKHMAVRFVASTIIASAIDSFLFTMIAFGSVYSWSHTYPLAFSIWLSKILIEVIGLPLSTKLAAKLKAIEKIDTYDYDTRFSIFSLDTAYQSRIQYSG